MVIFLGGEVAFFLGMFGAFGQLLAALMRRGLGAVARGGLLPIFDLLGHRRLVGVIGWAEELGVLGRRLHHGAADGLGLEEGPEVRGLDILGDRFGLSALAERFRQRQ